jgi:hypothetical protein
MTAPLGEKTFNNAIGGVVLYAKSTVDQSLVAVQINPATGELQIGDSAANVLLGQILNEMAAGNDRIIGEVVNETPNGILTMFTSDYAFVANSEEVKVNGLTMIRAVHYVPTGSLSRIVFEAAYIPAQGDIVTMNYWKA